MSKPADKQQLELLTVKVKAESLLVSPYVVCTGGLFLFYNNTYC